MQHALYSLMLFAATLTGPPAQLDAAVTAAASGVRSADSERRESADPEAAGEALLAKGASGPRASARGYAHFLRAMLALDGDPALAERELRAGLLYDRGSEALEAALIEARLRLAEELWDRGDLESARPVLRAVAEAGPDHPCALARLGLLLLELKELEEAARHLERAAELAPDDLVVLELLSRARAAAEAADSM